jgi:hypothetical protein
MQIICEYCRRNPDVNVCTEYRQFVNNKSNILSHFLLYYIFYENTFSLYLRLLFIITLEKCNFKIYLEENTLLDPDIDGRLLLKYIL